MTRRGEQSAERVGRKAGRPAERPQMAKSGERKAAEAAGQS